MKNKDIMKLIGLLTLLWLALFARHAFGQSLYDMRAVPANEREIYDTPIDFSGVDGTLWNDSSQQTAARDAVEDLVPNSSLSQFDFSGTSVGTWKHNRNKNGNDLPDEITRSLPVTLISATYGLASDHNGPIAGERVYFRNPAGDAVVGVVESSSDLDRYGDMRLVKFTTSLDNTLKRYPVLENVEDCHGRDAWWPDQDLTLRLRPIIGELVVNEAFPTYLYGVINYGASPWGDNITSGSGRPAWIALSDGTLVIAGTLWSSYSTTWPFYYIEDLEDEMGGETVTTYGVPTSSTTVPSSPNKSLMSPVQFNSFQFGKGL
jgi:hypothetical protein